MQDMPLYSIYTVILLLANLTLKDLWNVQLLVVMENF